MELIKKIKLVEKLFRVKPVIAWSFCTFVVTICSGIHDGLELNIFISALALLCLFIMQGILSHSTNDIVDEQVDKNTDMESTNRFKVLVSGIASRRDLYIICILSIISSLLIGMYIYFSRGIIILVFLFSGMFMIYAYNCKPLKLNYRPLSEFTIVFPTIMLIAFGIAYSAFGEISETIVYSAVVCSMMNVLWYCFSRMQDAVPDAKYGKNTTMAYFYIKGGIKSLVLKGYNYIAWMFILSILISGIIAVYVSYVYAISTICYWLFGGIFIYYINEHMNNKYSDIDYIMVSSELRRVGMYITYLHCALLSIVLLI